MAVYPGGFQCASAAPNGATIKVLWGMTDESIAEQRDSIINRFGEWTAHNIKLPEGVYTRGEGVPSEPKNMANGSHPL
jgi:hypothetical protein